MARIGVFIGLVFFMYILISYGQMWLKHKWGAGKKHMKANTLTMFDVRRMIMQGHKDDAINAYCQIFSTSRKEAKKSVEELAQSIQDKNV